MGYHEKHTRNAETWTVVMAIGVFFSPFVLDFAQGTMLANSVMVGFFIALFAVVRALVPRKIEWMSWINLIIGLWLFISPFVLGYTSSVAIWEAVIVGLVVAGTEFYSATETHAIATR